MILKKAAHVLNWMATMLGFLLHCQVIEQLGYDFKETS
jgi:hypothetical protein